MTTHISNRDERLLKKEGYIRRERRVCISLGVLCLLGMVAGSFMGRDQTLPDSAVSGGLVALAFFGGYACFCALRLRHIESIKRYTAIEKK